MCRRARKGWKYNKFYKLLLTPEHIQWATTQAFLNFGLDYNWTCTTQRKRHWQSRKTTLWTPWGRSWELGAKMSSQTNDWVLPFLIFFNQSPTSKRHNVSFIIPCQLHGGRRDGERRLPPEKEKKLSVFLRSVKCTKRPKETHTCSA